jgi:hypothetical protein
VPVRVSVGGSVVRGLGVPVMPPTPPVGGAVGVAVGWGTGVGVAVAAGTGVAVAVGAGVGVAVGTGVGVAVGTVVGVAVGTVVGVAVARGVGVGVGSWHAPMERLNVFVQPLLPVGSSQAVTATLAV